MYGQVIRPPPGIPDGLFGGEQIHDLVLSPLSTVINFGDLQFYRIGSGMKMLVREWVDFVDVFHYRYHGSH